MKNFIKKLAPTWALSFYHYSLALFGAFISGFPSSKMIVVGVTGTKGKTTAINMLWATLTAGGYKTGIITTANIKVGDEETLNRYHMTMPGRFVIQNAMRKMAKAGCNFCIVETTSEGIKQFRHIGINYDITVFTNLFPEHLTSHGGKFENYKNKKGELFAKLSKGKRKNLLGREIQKTIIANKDSEHFDFFNSFDADKKISYSIEQNADLRADKVTELEDGVEFSVGNERYKLGVIGTFNVYNALVAIAVSRILNISYENIKSGLQKLTLIPGRMEKINEGQDFTVIVDYAHERQSMTNMLKTANEIKKPGAKVIVLLGAEGGGRDKAKRPAMGEVSAKFADYVVVSNVDPYDDDPREIVEDIVASALKFGKKRDENIFAIQDRREGIRKALSLARTGDIVIITGKGAEQSMIIRGKKIPWDDRAVVREELKSI